MLGVAAAFAWAEAAPAAPLWTATPTPVDRSRETRERLPSALDRGDLGDADTVTVRVDRHPQLDEAGSFRGEGRRWIGYAIELPIGETAFMAGDRLLVAWPLDAGPLPVPADATSGEDLARDLAGAFGLSGAEASLAARLADCDLRQAAERCGIGYETARSHLKSIFRRIGLTRQSELTALLTRFVFHADLRRGLTAASAARIDPIG